MPVEVPPGHQNRDNRQNFIARQLVLGCIKKKYPGATRKKYPGATRYQNTCMCDVSLLIPRPKLLKIIKSAGFEHVSLITYWFVRFWVLISITVTNIAVLVHINTYCFHDVYTWMRVSKYHRRVAKPGTFYLSTSWTVQLWKRKLATKDYVSRHYPSCEALQSDSNIISRILQVDLLM